jgi:OOP family OmpA-OmpF porin
VGCPVLFVLDEVTQRVAPLVLQGVNFATGSSRLTQGSYAVLNVVAVSLLGHPEVRIEIGGHTDATGGYDLNMRLSRGRAEAVRAYLAQQGVPLSQMEARGYGPDQPIATNATSAGRSANRRVELRQKS